MSTGEILQRTTKLIFKKLNQPQIRALLLNPIVTRANTNLKIESICTGRITMHAETPANMGPITEPVYNGRSG